MAEEDQKNRNAHESESSPQHFESMDKAELIKVIQELQNTVNNLGERVDGLKQTLEMALYRIGQLEGGASGNVGTPAEVSNADEEALRQVRHELSGDSEVSTGSTEDGQGGAIESLAEEKQHEETLRADLIEKYQKRLAVIDEKINDPNTKGFILDDLHNERSKTDRVIRLFEKAKPGTLGVLDRMERESSIKLYKQIDICESFFDQEGELTGRGGFLKEYIELFPERGENAGVSFARLMEAMSKEEKTLSKDKNKEKVAIVKEVLEMLKKYKHTIPNEMNFFVMMQSGKDSLRFLKALEAKVLPEQEAKKAESDEEWDVPYKPERKMIEAVEVFPILRELAFFETMELPFDRSDGMNSNDSNDVNNLHGEFLEKLFGNNYKAVLSDAITDEAKFKKVRGGTLPSGVNRYYRSRALEKYGWAVAKDVKKPFIEVS